MAVILQMTYSKKLGLPNFSSHSCSVSLQVEIADVSQVTGEARKLYALTQDAVDREIQQVGWLPDATTYGMINGESQPANANGHHVNGSGNGHRVNGSSNGEWACSDKQKDLVLKFIRENQLDKSKIEDLAQEMFDKGVIGLNRLEMSGVIAEMFTRYGKRDGATNGSRSRYPQQERSRA